MTDRQTDRRPNSRPTDRQKNRVIGKFYAPKNLQAFLKSSFGHSYVYNPKHWSEIYVWKSIYCTKLSFYISVNIIEACRLCADDEAGYQEEGVPRLQSQRDQDCPGNNRTQVRVKIDQVLELELSRNRQESRYRSQNCPGNGARIVKVTGPELSR